MRSGANLQIVHATWQLAALQNGQMGIPWNASSQDRLRTEEVVEAVSHRSRLARWRGVKRATPVERDENCNFVIENRNAEPSPTTYANAVDMASQKTCTGFRNPEAPNRDWQGSQQDGSWIGHARNHTPMPRQHPWRSSDESALSLAAKASREKLPTTPWPPSRSGSQRALRCVGTRR